MPLMFEEMKRYVRFEAGDQAALRDIAPSVRPHFRRIAEEFYQRLEEHPDAVRVFADSAQVQRLKSTLCDWMELLLTGPWDDAYYQKRRRIGHMHVKIALPQRYMFGAMDLIRVAMIEIAGRALENDAAVRDRTVAAICKILDLELTIMLETYRDAFVDKVQHLERVEKELLTRQLAVSEARYEQIVEQAEVLVITCDAEGHILLFNRRCEEVTGVARGEAIGRKLAELIALPTELEAVQQLRADAAAGRRIAPAETTVRGPSGQHRVRWHFTALPTDGPPIVCAIGVDVTEERSAQARMRRNERLASLGTMAAGLAHEIRNPLNAAQLQLTVVQRRLGRSSGADIEGAKGAAEIVMSEMKRLAGLVGEFLQFARPQPLRLARADLRATCTEVLALVGAEATTLGSDLALDEGVGVLASIDDERMKQVLLNLVRNALEATGRGGKVRLRVAAREGEAHLSVEDDGPGLPSSDAPVFEPFFTTKEGGTGLGLAIVDRIIADHGGRIGVESRPGRTIFSIALPLG
jgi:PAS domain S-box-containing protein